MEQPENEVGNGDQSKDYLNIPMIKSGTLEERAYQKEVASVCSEKNTLVMLPTGLGKTAIALIVVADFLSRDKESRVLILAPTRVLVNQHYSFFKNHLDLSLEQIGMITGEDPDDLRDAIWKKRVICATPQVTVSDLQKKRCKVEDFSLIIFDEVHRAVGNHAYSLIATNYNEFRPEGRMIGMTASLPSDKEKIEEIVSKLKIQKVEIRDEKSKDVRPFVFKTDVEWIKLELSPSLKSIQGLVRDALDSRIRLLEDASLIKRSNYRSISLKDLLRLRTKIEQIQSSQLKNALFSSIRLFHALNLVETQSLSAFAKFLDRLNERKRGYGMSELLNDRRIIEAHERSRAALLAGIEHPKIEEMLSLVERVKNGERAIIFASYRDTVDQIYSELVKHGFKAGYLIGKSGEGGQTQKTQVKSLEELRAGVFDILVATQVGEEGLDVADCNVVIFYDNVPSAVRFVQRKGRTGRRRAGHMYVLMTKGTRDEAYFWMSRRRVRDAKQITTSLVETRRPKSGPLDRFVEEVFGDEENFPTVYADTREISELVEKIRARGARVIVKQLDFGDFVVSSDIVFERKTLEDFVKSIYDGRLFKQLTNIVEKYSRPILIIQGEKKYLSGISESAYYGALASVLADFHVPIFFASNEKEVAEIIFSIARREQIEKNKRETRIREGRKPATLSERQRYIISGIPGVSGVLADRLLTELSTVEKLFSTSELDLMSVNGIGEVMARRIRELSTAKYVSATPSEIEKIAAKDSLEHFTSTEHEPNPPAYVPKVESKSENESEDLDIPPPAED